ncbi:ABC transporter ATP-binding protein/permease [Candidatus Pelagibacter ubique]|nr:ABC transporter ATP-binding protein/permease [Candidatus Pelagibacter ubique]
MGLLLLCMMLIMAFLDLLGVASILPFMAVLTNPSLFETNTILNMMFLSAGSIGIETKEEFIFILGILVFFLLVFTLTFKALTEYAKVRFSMMREYSICNRLLNGYLNQPYVWFLKNNSASISKNVLAEVSTVVNTGLAPLLNIISHSIVVIVLLGFLIFIDPKLSLGIGFTLGAAYLIIYKLSKNFITQIGYGRLSANEERYNSLNEAFGASKQLKVSGLEQTYFERFKNPAKKFAQQNTSLIVVSQLPRFALEAIAFGGMLLLILYFLSEKGNFIDAIPVIALYAFAGYRLMPALQQIYKSIAEVRFAVPALDALYDDLKRLQPRIPQRNKDIMQFNKAITLNNIFYNYPDTSQEVLKDISLNIPFGSTVGFVGATGSGKTTIIDVILGLLEPQKGTLEVDDKIINNQNVRAWQSSIGYVPQEIYLADDTIAANIAFGIEAKNINQEDIKRVAKIARLHEFVKNELPSKYQTIVGERGVRLSGGQRQRIGIARALYHNPKVIIFDEATSALDNQTEQSVMDSINNLGNKITVIIIAHRLTTVRACNTIFLLEKGELKGKGNFEDLRKDNEKFQAMLGNISY